MADGNILTDFGINLLEEEIDDVIFQTNEFLTDATYTLVPSTKVQICPVKNEQMNLFLSFITHFSIILYHDRFFKVSDTLLHVLPLNNVSLIIVHCSRQMPIIRIGICTLLLSDLIQILRL